MSTGHEVTIPAGQGAPETPAYAALPRGATRGVVIIHEIYGRRPEIDRVVERFAEAGFAAVAPDLFRRGRVRCLAELFAALRTGSAAATVPGAQSRNARTWLCGRADLAAGSIGLIGFCFGGGYALAAGAGWAAVSTNYGPVPPASALLGLGPVIGCYGARDRLIPGAPEQLRRRLGALGHPGPEVHVLDAGHSFLTDAPPTLYTRLMPLVALGDYPEARAEGWRRILAFFERHLG